ncbi:MAG TPA: amino acid adenylation domain-containing protein, partial [Polyangiaceae bacterium]|nr:amino acid adenylation domain-containing protein [Polyangiaceae bacterium]
AAQDLALWFLEGPTGAVGGLNYNLDIYEAETAERIKESYLELIDAIVAEPERPVRELAAIGNRERAALEAYNATTTATPEASCLATFLAPAFADHRDRIAARCGDRGVTYGALWARAGAIASALRGRGVAPGDVVGVHVERSIDMLAALLGTTRAGASYLPLDPSFPPERLAFMLADANASVVISDEALPETLGETRGSALRLSEVPEAADGPVHEAEGEDVAYLIYTSGSTGKPKGVRIPHRALLNFLASMAETPGLSREDRLVAVTTLSFDIAELELLLPLSVGAEVVIASKEDVTDGHRLRALLDEATVMQATPATWRLLLEAGWRGRQGFKILCGGEALPEDLAEKLLGCGELWNMYGPTETTIWSSCAKIEPGSGAVTVGRPIANTKIWVVDERDALVPLGATGEILIGGAGVALGYHNRPELDAERFLDDPFGHGGRLYRTGDLGRMRHDMTLQHLGRRDFQVKVRGFRIELGEIEKALADHVGPAVVVTRPGPGGEPRLVAYVVGEALPPAAELRDRLRATLPEYMLPSVFVPIAAIPTTPNGKVDRKALPAPPEARPAARDAVDGAPRTTSEKMVAAVWKDLLEIDRVSRSDNFLDLGGHSLLIMRAVTILEKETGKRVSPRAFVFQNLGQIALEYEQPEPEPEVPSAPEPVAQRLVSRLISAFRRRP